MLKNLPKHSSLLIVSDTPMWQTTEGVKVFEPTLREVEWLAEGFARITWIGYGHLDNPKTFARLTLKFNIDFIVLPYAAGGSSLLQKLRILRFLPMLMITIFRQIRKHNYIHTRGPAVPTLIAILFSYFDRSRTYWHKYAGNWVQKNPPFSYFVQRLLLRRNPHVVTVNGKWQNDPCNVMAFENPCFSETELASAKKIASTKTFTDESIQILYVGRIESEKGIFHVLDAAEQVDRKNIFWTVVGSGRDEIAVIEKAKNIQNVVFIGAVNRESLNEYYKRSHIFLLPTVASEGFPKVIAEAAAFGCVPVVGSVSSIGQYVKHGINGMVLNPPDAESVLKAINMLLSNDQKRIEMAQESVTMASLFTYERYCKRIFTEIFKV